MIPGLSTLTAKLAAGAAVLALVFAGVQTWRLSSAHSALEKKRNELATEVARHAVTRQSVGTLEAVIADLNRQAEARAAEFAASKERARKAEAENARLAAASDRTIARLREMAEQPGGFCETPGELAELARGL